MRTSTRARSDDQKHERHAAILSAAREMIEELGFEGVKMSALANRAGLAKGTLYLYVRSKEELFLHLFLEAFEALVMRFEREAHADMSAEALAEYLTALTVETPLFLPLYARLIAVIEANVADEPLFDAKRNLIAKFERFKTHFGAILGLDVMQTELVAGTMMNTLLGTAQFDLTAGRDPAGLPEDMREAFANNAFERNFPPAAAFILTAAKALAD
ncbi:TetR/AcrR family transcriptional regulator [Aliiroseovarius sp. 2305UL8-7]|uniref:TetR/AcrR family transcriptional regulator n=1 Tax=Aliiroseovarius conchicola TaxID=3121637 RepID=UPI0035297AFA